MEWGGGLARDGSLRMAAPPFRCAAQPEHTHASRGGEYTSVAAGQRRNNITFSGGLT
jgi:hypothetical protein